MYFENIVCISSRLNIFYQSIVFNFLSDIKSARLDRYAGYVLNLFIYKILRIIFTLLNAFVAT